MKTFAAVLPNGKQAVKNSTMEIGWLVAHAEGECGDWEPASWHMTHESARFAARRLRKRLPTGSDTKIIKVINIDSQSS